MAPAPRSANKHDVALADVHRKADRELAIIRALSVLGWIAASALPIWALSGIVKDLAGKTTVVNVSVALSIVVTVSIVVNVAQYAKIRSQRRALQSQRTQITSLEEGTE